jgi:hypothetical protein
MELVKRFLVLLGRRDLPSKLLASLADFKERV